MVLPTALTGVNRWGLAGVVLTQLVDTEFTATVAQLIVEGNSSDQKTVRSGHCGERISWNRSRDVGRKIRVRCVVFVVFPCLFGKTIDGAHCFLAFNGAHMLLVSGVHSGDHDSKHKRSNSDFNQREALGQFHFFSRLVGIREVYRIGCCNATPKLNKIYLKKCDGAHALKQNCWTRQGLPFTLPQNGMNFMTTEDLIEALKRKDDVGPLLSSFDKKVLYQRQVLIALQCHYTPENLNAFEQHGFELKDMTPGSIWTPGVDPEFFKKYLYALRDHGTLDPSGQNRSESVSHSFIATLCFNVFSLHAHTDNLFEQYVTLFEQVLEVFGDAYLYSLRPTSIYYDYGPHWTDKHWQFYNTYCTKSLEWDMYLSEVYERPIANRQLQRNLVNFVSQDPKLSTLWNTLERESLERQKIFDAFLPQLEGGRARGARMPFFAPHFDEKDLDIVDVRLLWDFDSNTVVNKEIDRVLGFDLSHVYQYTGLRFHHLSRLNAFIPKLVFPSFQHQQIANVNKTAPDLEPQILFTLLQHPLTRRNFLEGASVTDIRHVLKHTDWLEWRDDVGNSFAHLLLGFSSHKKQSWVRLIGARSAWMDVRNFAGFTPRDVLAENCGEGDLELYDKTLLRNTLKGTRKNKPSTKRKI